MRSMQQSKSTRTHPQCCNPVGGALQPVAGPDAGTRAWRATAIPLVENHDFFRPDGRSTLRWRYRSRLFAPSAHWYRVFDWGLSFDEDSSPQGRTMILPDHR